jgi:hypothetical protein
MDDILGFFLGVGIAVFVFVAMLNGWWRLPK